MNKKYVIVEFLSKMLLISAFRDESLVYNKSIEGDSN